MIRHLLSRLACWLDGHEWDAANLVRVSAHRFKVTCLRCGVSEVWQ